VGIVCSQKVFLPRPFLSIFIGPRFFLGICCLPPTCHSLVSPPTTTITFSLPILVHLSAENLLDQTQPPSTHIFFSRPRLTTFAFYPTTSSPSTRDFLIFFFYQQHLPRPPASFPSSHLFLSDQHSSSPQPFPLSPSPGEKVGKQSPKLGRLRRRFHRQIYGGSAQ